MGRTTNIAGICGAPCTGKTTLASALWYELSRQGLRVPLLAEPARRLAAQGVKIDDSMGSNDYARFLKAYRLRDRVMAPLCIADRTPIDHLSYIEVNQNLPQRVREFHRRQAYAALDRYGLLLYLPVEIPLVADGFRVTSAQYQHQLDAAIRRLLGGVSIPVVAVKGEPEERLRQSLFALGQVWPSLLARKVLV
jgi:nicotinamide riboside kinase